MSTHDGRGHLQSTPHFNGTILLTPLSVNEKSHESHLFTLALSLNFFLEVFLMILPQNSHADLGTGLLIQKEGHLGHREVMPPHPTGQPTSSSQGPSFWGSTLDTVDSLFYQLLKPSLYFLLTIFKLFDKQSVIQNTVLNLQSINFQSLEAIP